ncbi:MAG: hypothetical protein M3220_22715 [Chloroflexota bacterium]|nr:hypothetical protein [Chloroflexota bacterium]
MADEGLFDEGEVRDELSHVADVGFDFVRVSLPWETLQPSATRLRTAVLDRLAALLDTAVDAELTVQLTLAGQLGGTLFLPRWMLATDPLATPRPTTRRVISEGWETMLKPGDLYGARDLLDGQRKVWSEITHNFAPHPALSELDLGAGGLLTSLPPKNEDEALHWWEVLEEAVQEAGTVENLLYSDGPRLLMLHELPRLETWEATVGTLAVAASPTGNATARGGADTQWPRFLLLLARTLAGAPVACASLGLPTQSAELVDVPTLSGTEEEPVARLPLFAEAEQARFFGEVLPALHDAGVPFICHAVWADAPQSLSQQPPYDRNRPLRHSGLLRADGDEKEVANVWRTFSRQQQESVEQGARTLEVDADEWYKRRDEEGFVESLYQRFLGGEL